MTNWPVFLAMVVGTMIYFLAPRRSTRERNAEAEPDHRDRDGLMGRNYSIDLDIVWATAGHAAGDDRVEPEHLLLAALRHPGVESVLQRSIEEARDKLLASLAERKLASDPIEALLTDRGEGKVGAATLAVIDRAHALGGVERGGAMSVRDVVDALREQGGVFADLLPEGELPALERRRASATITAPAPVAAPYRSSGEVVDVYMVNDDVTTMDFVLKVLVDELGLTELEAAYTMYETHYDGLGFVARLSRDEANERVARILERARAEAMPLEVRVVPAQ